MYYSIARCAVTARYPDMRQATTKKRTGTLTPLLLGFCALCALAVFLLLRGRVDTSDWVYHRFDDLGISSMPITFGFAC